MTVNVTQQFEGGIEKNAFQKLKKVLTNTKRMSKCNGNIIEGNPRQFPYR